MRREHRELIEGDYQELFPDDEKIFAYSRESGSGKCTILINFSIEQASYDAACVEDAELLVGTRGETVKGILEPLEAVVFSRPCAFPVPE